MCYTGPLCYKELRLESIVNMRVIKIEAYYNNGYHLTEECGGIYKSDDIIVIPFILMFENSKFSKYGIIQGTVLCPERNYHKYFSTSPFVSPHNLEI